MVNFIKVPNDFIIKYYIQNITELYNSQKFGELRDYIKNFIEENPFMKKEDKKKVLEIYKINIKLKRIIDKIINKYRQRKSYEKSINTSFLSLESIFTSKNTIKIMENSCNKSYTFTKNELTQIFKQALISQSECFPNPKIPSNPWTNIEFNMKQLIYIYNLIECNKTPIIIRLFKQSGFDIDVFTKINYRFLSHLACETYIKDVSDEDFEEVFDDFLDDIGKKPYICK